MDSEVRNTTTQSELGNQHNNGNCGSLLATTGARIETEVAMDYTVWLWKRACTDLENRRTDKRMLLTLPLQPVWSWWVLSRPYERDYGPMGLWSLMYFAMLKGVPRRAPVALPTGTGYRYVHACRLTRCGLLTKRIQLS